jgi:predicted nucleic acid-binding protein
MRIVVDSSVLIAAVNSADTNHLNAYSFIRDRPSTSWVVPATTYFEFQAAQSRLGREGRTVLRELYLPNAEVFAISQVTFRLASERGLFESLSPLRGMDLVVGCVAALEDLPLATSDMDFKSVEAVIAVIWV